MTAPVLVQRENLSARTAISKSEVGTRFYCGVQGFYARTLPRPWNVTPEMTFGSALDAAVEQLLMAQRAGIPLTDAKPIEAAQEVAARDECDVDLDEIRDAVLGFVDHIIPLFDWSFCGLQTRLEADIPGIGMVQGHPDVILADGTVLDVKAAGRDKRPEDIWAKPELPIYAALYEAARGERPARVGYLVWARLKKPRWQFPPLLLDVDDDLIAEGLLELGKQANLRRQYDVLAEKGVDPARYLPGPSFPEKCRDCAWTDVCSVGQRRLRRLQTEGIAA